MLSNGLRGQFETEERRFSDDRLLLSFGIRSSVGLSLLSVFGFCMLGGCWSHVITIGQREFAENSLSIHHQLGITLTVICGFIITSGIAFAAIGGVLGYAIGTFAPDYYRIMFHIPPSIELDPVQAGLGLGLTQGLAAGLVIGLVIVVACAWYRSRLTNRSTEAKVEQGNFD